MHQKYSILPSIPLHLPQTNTYSLQAGGIRAEVSDILVTSIILLVEDAPTVERSIVEMHIYSN